MKRKAGRRYFHVLTTPEADDGGSRAKIHRKRAMVLLPVPGFTLFYFFDFGEKPCATAFANHSRAWFLSLATPFPDT